jgi:hypothetical protein
VRRANAASTLSSDSTSHWQNTAPVSAAAASPCSAFKSKIATLAPAARNAFTVARPRPDAPPVTTAARDSSIFIRFLCADGPASG